VHCKEEEEEEEEQAACGSIATGSKQDCYSRFGIVVRGVVKKKNKARKDRTGRRSNKEEGL
jgi:hypothetical protein